MVARLAKGEKSRSLTQDQYRALLDEIDELRRKEDMHLGQPSRLKWLKFGDKNSRYFHKIFCKKKDF